MKEANRLNIRISDNTPTNEHRDTKKGTWECKAEKKIDLNQRKMLSSWLPISNKAEKNRSKVIDLKIEHKQVTTEPSYIIKRTFQPQVELMT